MNDKERILMTIISRVIPGLCVKIRNPEEYVKINFLGKADLQPGDLVLANTTIEPNDFMVAFVDHFDVVKDCVVVREIGSDKLCDYYNESFSAINKEKLGYEVLEGVQYKTYKKALKAFAEYANYTIRFRSISFENDICTLTARRMFENSEEFSVKFRYASKTTIKEIGKMIEEKEKQK